MEAVGEPDPPVEQQVAPQVEVEPLGDLGSFIRRRRERLRPAEVGLPDGGRRRTPGLRREELAMLAGISMDYLVRLEQGRETNPSASVLASLARALHLESDAYLHLKHLAGQAALPEMCPTASEHGELEPSTLRLLDRLHPTPAFVLELNSDVSAWNDAYERLMAATGLFDHTPPNLLRYTFLVPASRSVFPDWDAVAREQVGNLRAATGMWPDDPALAGLVGELSVSSRDFASMWACYDVGEKRRGRKRLNHPVVGELAFDFEALSVPSGCYDRRLVTYLPVADADTRGVDRLLAGGLPAEDPGSPSNGAYLRVVADN